MSITSKQWSICKVGNGGTSFNSSLAFQTVQLPVLGRYDVLVKFHAASLNYRDVAMATGKYGFPVKEGVVAGSDAAGEVVAIGPGVIEFKPGDRVATCFFQDWLAGLPSETSLVNQLGSVVDGVFRQYGIFPAHGLIAVPPSLDWREASTLTCAALTAWGCLHGTKPMQAGDVVLIQGTGGVSIFALQFARLAGARVIATTSSDEKAAFLKKLGAEHVVNYRTEPDWGLRVRERTPNQRGCDVVLDVGGSGTWSQSLKALRSCGEIHMIGFLSSEPADPVTLAQLFAVFGTAKPGTVGSRAQFAEMNKAIEAFGIKPVVDPTVFDLEQLGDAYAYLASGKHFGKVVVNI